MFRWLPHWRRPVDPLVRGLYAYHDGKRGRLADPLVISAALDKAGKGWEDHLATLEAVTTVPTSGKLATIAAEGQDTAIRELVRISREAFGLAEVDDRGRGLSGAEVLHVLAGYLTFLNRIRERWGPFVKLPARPADCPPADTGSLSPSGSPAMAADVNA